MAQLTRDVATKIIIVKKTADLSVRMSTRLTFQQMNCVYIEVKAVNLPNWVGMIPSNKLPFNCLSIDVSVNISKHKKLHSITNIPIGSNVQFEMEWIQSNHYHSIVCNV